MSRKRTKKFVAIDRNIFEAALKIKIGGRARAVLFAFLLQTNGFEKEFDKISWKRYTNLTGIGKEQLSYIKKVLIKEGCMYEKDSILYIQKDLSKWKGLPNSVTLEGVNELDNKGYRIRQPEVTEFGKHILTPHLNSQNNKLSAKLRKKKHEEFKKGMEMMKEAIGKVPGSKK